MSKPDAILSDFLTKQELARGAPRNGAGTSSEKSWHTLFDVEFTSRETYATEFAAFEQHKTALLDILLKAYERESEPFDEQIAWRDLIGAAIWLFRRKKIRPESHCFLLGVANDCSILQRC
jgi:hypothetical protein